MIIEQEILPFLAWLLGKNELGQGSYANGALFLWLSSLGVLLGVAILVGLLIIVSRHGFRNLPRVFGQSARRALANMIGFSFRRTWAIARLTIKESLRRRVLLIFVLFLVLLLMAGWFIDPNNNNPASLYLTFVLSASGILITLLTLFLSSFSLPTDFKEKTIYTVVTKPVRSGELVMGRVLGVGLVGTTLLACMGVASYLFVTSGLQHNHILVSKDLQDLDKAGSDGENTENPKRIVQRGETQLRNGHKHPVVVLADGTIITEEINAHTHQITSSSVENQSAEGQVRYLVANEQGTIEARVPIYGRLTFRDEKGMDTEKGVNVGDEWEYRSYIAGSSSMVNAANEEAAIYSFRDIQPRQFPKERFPLGMPVEMTLGVFRTHKGDIEKQVMCSLTVRNPKTGLAVEVQTFPSEEFITKKLLIPWTLEGTPQLIQRNAADATRHPDDALIQEEQEKPQFTQSREFDFFKDFVADGEFEVWLKVVDAGQYVGVARTDLYLRADNRSVALNFVKGYFGIWMQIIVITLFGVLFSTFLSGPLAMLATIGVMIAGFSKAFLIEIGLNKVLGGGPFESLYRLLIQQNMVVDLPNTFSTTFIKTSDLIFSFFMRLCGQGIPPLGDYAIYQEAVVKGFDVPGNWLMIHGVMTLSFVVPVFIVAYLILSNREVAK